MYAGKEPARDDCGLWEYGVQNEATLEMLGRLRGGMPTSGCEDGVKVRKLAFESDADMPHAPSQQFEA